MTKAEADSYSNLDLRGALPETSQASVRFAFEFPELLEAFERVDAVAGRMRKRSRTIGFLAIGLVLLALMLASADSVLAALDHDTHEALGYLAAVLGLLGTAIALWSRGKSAPRARWLKARFQTETLRQFHFLFLSDRLPDVVSASGDPNKEAAFQQERAALFATFKTRVLDQPDKAYRDQLSEAEISPLAGLIEETPAEGVAMTRIAVNATDAWIASRLKWQLNYCNAKLTLKKGSLKTPRSQEWMFGFIGWACIAVLIGIHLLHFFEHWLHLSRTWMQIGVVWTALFALASRAIESGLAPQREVERYEQYRVNIRTALARCESAVSFASKVESMRAFERVCREEMVVFLRTHERSHFIL
ncbi:MAG: hypothetical protein R3C52_12265 [Hyphomonadaceae bacterium]